MDEGKIRDMASHMRSCSKNDSLFSVKPIKFYFHSFWLHSFIWTAHEFCLSPSTLNMSILWIQYSCAWFESRSWIQCKKRAISMDEGKIRDMAGHMRSCSKNDSLFSVKPIKFYFHSFWLQSFIWTAHEFCLSPSTLNMSILWIQYSCTWFESRSWIQCKKRAISMDEGKIRDMAGHMRSCSKNDSLFSVKPIKFYFHSFWLHSFIWTAHEFCLSPSTLIMSIVRI